MVFRNFYSLYVGKKLNNFKDVRCATVKAWSAVRPGSQAVVLTGFANTEARIVQKSRVNGAAVQRPGTMPKCATFRRDGGRCTSVYGIAPARRLAAAKQSGNRVAAAKSDDAGSDRLFAATRQEIICNISTGTEHRRLPCSTEGDGLGARNFVDSPCNRIEKSRNGAHRRKPIQCKDHGISIDRLPQQQRPMPVAAYLCQAMAGTNS